jgi:hypothetical protein
MSKYLEFTILKGLAEGHPYEVIPDRLNRITEGLRGLGYGKNSGLKYVYRIADTG